MKTKNTLALLAAVFLHNATAFAQTWTQTSAPITNWWSIASSADGTKLIAATAWGEACEIYISTNSGRAWVLNYFMPVADACVDSSADGTVLAALGAAGVSGQTNGFCISTNSGTSWRCVPNVANSWWSSVAISVDGRKLVALGGIPEEIITSTNFGTTWINQARAPVLGSQSGWVVASSADGTKLIAAQSNGGMIYISTNSGVNWVSNMYNTAGCVLLHRQMVPPWRRGLTVA